jgi:hypothetical protein
MIENEGKECDGRGTKSQNDARRDESAHIIGVEGSSKTARGSETRASLGAMMCGAYGNVCSYMTFMYPL